MKYGFAQENITPQLGVCLEGYFEPRPNRGVLDQLSAKAVLFQDDNGICGIVCFDVIALHHNLVQRMINAMKDAGISFADCLLLCTVHTHTGPYTGNFDHSDAEYLDTLVMKTVLAVKRAWQNMTEGEYLTGVTTCNTLSFNRRYWMKDGSVMTNPGKCNPNIDRPEGPIDPQIPMLAIRENGELRLLIVNISNHADTIGGDLVSADWPGRMEKEIQTCLGHDIPVITLISCQGNINHFNVKNNANQTCYEEACRIGKGYAHAILSELYTLKPMEATAFSFASKEFDAPYATVTDEEYQAAKTILREIDEAPAQTADDLTSEGLANGSNYVKRYFAQLAVECREHPITEKRTARMLSICFGKDLAIVSMPGEPFIELQLKVKAASPFGMTMVVALGMEYIGYICSEEAFANGGGYETRPFPDAPAHTLPAVLVNTANELLTYLFRRGVLSREAAQPC